MFPLYEIFTLIICHFVFDFIFQTDWQAKNKSSNNEALLNHTIIYSVCWGIPIIILVGIKCPHLGEGYFYLWKAVQFILITFFCHTITDYITSRENKKLWESGNTHGFFVGIGFDAVLHYIQLFLTYLYITK